MCKYNQKISIVIATLNVENYLQITIDSIKNLEYKNIELIIVDGGSKDKTLELIKKNNDFIHSWISEEDGGIYDAWNKGVLLSHGDWICFLGAGDSLKKDSLDTCLKLIKNADHESNFISGRASLVDINRKILRQKGAAYNYQIFRKFMCISHVGALHKKSLFLKYGLFNTSYKSSSDYDFLLRCGYGLKAKYNDAIMAEVLVGGISNSSHALYETYQIHLENGVNYFQATLIFFIAHLKRIPRKLFYKY